MAKNNESNIMIAAVFNAADPMRSVVRDSASGKNRPVVFYNHIYDALAQLPLPRADQSVLITARTDIFESGVTAAFEMLFKSCQIHFILWHSHSLPLVSQPHAICCGRLHYITTAEQFDSVINTLAAAARPQVSRPPILTGRTLKLPDTPLTEDEMDALLGVGL